MLKRGWILTIAVVVMMAMGSRHAASAELVIQLKRGVTLNRNVTIKVGGGAGFVCGTDTVDDVDGNTYSTVLIGDQCWLGENFRCTRNADGSAVNGTGDPDTTPPSAYPSAPVEEGLLYNWQDAMNGEGGCNGTGAGQPACSTPVQGICLDGWHIPSHYEWTALELEVCTSGSCATDFPYDTITTGGRGTTEGDEMKKAGLCESRNPCGTSGFEGLLAGYRKPDGNYILRGTGAYLRSSTPSGGDVWYRDLNVSFADVYRAAVDKESGFSVRCLKD